MKDLKILFSLTFVKSFLFDLNIVRLFLKKKNCVVKLVKLIFWKDEQKDNYCQWKLDMSFVKQKSMAPFKLQQNCRVESFRFSATETTAIKQSYINERLCMVLHPFLPAPGGQKDMCISVNFEFSQHIGWVPGHPGL